MDAFYASVELLRAPQYRGKPLAIGGRRSSDGSISKRGVLTTANYEARAYGVHSAMPVGLALQKCPELVLLPVDFPAYRQASRQFKQALLAIAPVMEDRGIDEVYLDLSAHPEAHGGQVIALGQRLQQAVREATQLTCSIGLAPNKLLAKIASDLNKPAGLTVLDQEHVPGTLWPLPVRKLHGVGPKAQAKLEGLGLRSIGEIAQAPTELLIDVFGERYGQWLHAAAHGQDDRPVVTHSDPISRSRETTFGRDLHLKGDWIEIARTLSGLIDELCADLQRRGWVARTAGVKVRTDDFRIITRDVGLREPTWDTSTIRKAAFEALARANPQRRLRLIGIRASGLQPESSVAIEPHQDARVGLPVESAPQQDWLDL
jgi:DNA polymerase-4